MQQRAMVLVGWLARASLAIAADFVGETTRERFYRLGRLQRTTASEFWLREGVIGGVPYPSD